MIRFKPIDQSAHVGWAAASIFGVAVFHPSLVVWALVAVIATAIVLEVLDHFVKKVQTLLEALIDVAFYTLGSGVAVLALKLAHKV